MESTAFRGFFRDNGIRHGGVLTIKSFDAKLQN